MQIKHGTKACALESATKRRYPELSESWFNRTTFYGKANKGLRLCTLARKSLTLYLQSLTSCMCRTQIRL